MVYLAMVLNVISICQGNSEYMQDSGDPYDENAAWQSLATLNWTSYDARLKTNVSKCREQQVYVHYVWLLISQNTLVLMRMPIPNGLNMRKGIHWLNLEHLL